MLRRVRVPSPIAQWRSRRAARRLQGQLPLVAQVLAAHLHAGRSLRQAIADGSGDLPEPSAGRMREAARSLEFGASAAQALLILGPGEDVRLMATATELQARFGGDLAALFEGIGDALYERAALQRAAAVATAQARATGRVVSVMPLVAMGALWMLDRPALAALLHSPLGWAAIAVSGGLVFGGHVLIGRISAVDP